jgi:putative pyruvate formate lyase activating enzyme
MFEVGLDKMWSQRPDAAAVLNDEEAKKSLSRYFAVMQNQRLAKFLIAKMIPATFNKDDSTEKLWREHTRLTEEFCRIEKELDDTQGNLREMSSPEKSYLELKIEIAERILHSCHLCMRQCSVNRTEGESGYCGCSLKIVVSSVFEHMGEEPELVPSGTIFTMGCTMKCKHCQNWTISQWVEQGNVYDPARLAGEVERLRVGGCRNVNLVGGEPTPWLHQWLETFKHVNANVPIIWNSNSYYSPKSAALLAGFADVYLLDFKYGPGRCAERISDAPSYWGTCTYNHLAAKKHGELIIRILVLPNHLECCTKPIIHWIAGNLGLGTRMNLMFQYRPEWKASEVNELDRKLRPAEMQRAVQLAKEANLRNFMT